MRLKFWGGIIISAFFLYLVFRKVDTNELLNSFRGVNFSYIFIVLVLSVFRFWIVAMRWQILMAPTKNIPVPKLFSATAIGFMANNLLPARIGEFVRAYVLGKKENISKTLSFATIVVERVFDGMTLILFLVVSIFFFPFPIWVKSAGYAAFAFYLTVLIFMLLLKYQKDFSFKIAGFMLKPFPKRLKERILSLINSFTLGLDVLGELWKLFLVFLYSLLVWIVSAAGIYFTLLSVNINLPVISAFVVLVIITLGIIIPSSPGFVGTLQFFSVAGLALFSVSESRALGFSIVYHALQFIPITLIGLGYLWMENLSFREIRATH